MTRGWITYFGQTIFGLEPRKTCNLCCAMTVHVKMWRAAGVSVYTLPSNAREFTFRQAKKASEL